ncbi:MAG: iron ABC transporter permease [Pseudomonadota bacterium]
MRWHLPALVLLTVFLAVLSLHVGLRLHAPATVWAALTAPDGGADALIISGLRLPRMVAAGVVGAALGVSGLLMQAVLRNPLAEPGLLGVNAGASFAVVFAFAVLGVSGFLALSLFALAGAGAAMAAIFALVLGARGALTPVSLVLAGVTLAAFLASLTQVLIVTDEGTMESLLFWLAGGFADRDGAVLWAVAPLLVAGVALAALSAGALDAMATGDATARALGVDTGRLRFLVLALASTLAGLSVVIAGPVGFVGLVAPHIARLMAGVAHARLLPRTALIGASIALAADIAARRVVVPQEAPVTATLALIGAPVLVSLVRSRRLRAAA